VSTTTPDVNLSRYTDGRNRYVCFAREVLDIRLTREQERILRSLATTQRTVIMSGNGPGKSFGVAIAKLAFLVTNPGATVLGTSGSYSQYVDAVWRPMKQLHGRLDRRLPVDLGQPTDGGQPTLELDTDWFAKVVSPRDPGDLEGRHAAQMLVVVEEADKRYITHEHFDSAGSSVTDNDDRMLAVANPPLDETDVVAEKMQSERWHVIQFSSFESHNVRADADELDTPKIPGLVDLSTLKADWKEWNGERWPGFETARTAHERRSDLDERWYRRRAGIIPPDGAASHRPFYIADVEQAVDENPTPPNPSGLIGIGIDVARKGGDKTVYRRLYPGYTDAEEWSKRDHNDNEARIRDLLDAEPSLAPIAIDAVGEGSGLADRLQDAYPDVHRFKNGSKPDTDAGQDEYYDKWTEGLAALGDRLSGLAVAQTGDTRVREELFATARVVTFEEKRRRSGDVLKATPKSDVSDRLGHSPDSLDALVMAAWVADGLAFGEDEKPSPVPWS